MDLNKEIVHKNALKVLNQDFVWDLNDELAPFGSVDTKLILAFIVHNYDKASFNSINYLQELLQKYAQITTSDYNESLLDKELLEQQTFDPDFDDDKAVYTLDTCIIAMALSLFLMTGAIDSQIKPFVQTALKRQILWAQIADEWEESKLVVQRAEYLLKIFT